MQGSNKMFEERIAEKESWSFGHPVKTKRGNYNVFVHDTDGHSTIRMQTCKPTDALKMRAPFGISEPYQGSDPNPYRRSLPLTTDRQEIVEGFRDLDEFILDRATRESELWLKKKLSRAFVEARYTRIVSDPDKEKGYLPTIRTKVNMIGEHATKIWLISEKDGKSTYQRGQFTDVKKGCTVIPIIQLNGLWFISNKFGMTIVVTDLLVCQQQERPEFDFITDAPIEAADSMEVSQESHYDEPAPGPEDLADSKVIPLPGTPGSPTQYFSN